jgi:tetratricopeptide (TPR) repeat protein
MLDEGKMLMKMKQFNKALQKISEIREFAKGYYRKSINPVAIISEYLSGLVMLRKGDQESARNNVLAIQRMVETHQLDDLFLDYSYLLQAEIKLFNGDVESALQVLNRLSIYSFGSPRFYLLKARALAATRKIDEALDIFHKTINNITGRSPIHGGGDQFDYFYVRSLGDYIKGRFHEQNDDITLAIQYLDKAIIQWQNADRDLPQLKDAQDRLTSLKSLL